MAHFHSVTAEKTRQSPLQSRLVDSSIDMLHAPAALEDIIQDGNCYSSELRVSRLLYGLIIGKKGATLRGIERQTATDITVPRSKAQSAVIIRGQSRAAVEEALARIRALLDPSTQRMPATHFLSAATNTQQLQERFGEFRARVLATPLSAGHPHHGIDQTLFQLPHKLHLTLFVLVLADQTAINRVKAAIGEFRREHGPLFVKPFVLDIRGLGFWGKDAATVRVLYGKVAETPDEDRLKTLANELQQFLLVRKLIPSGDRNSVNLHMTVMNASFHDSGQHRRRRHFDCSAILDQFGDWEFGTVAVPHVQLCEIDSATASDFYTVVDTVVMETL